MEEKLIKILKSLRRIEPESDFSTSLKKQVFAASRVAEAAPQRNSRLPSFGRWMLEGLKFAGALTLASLLVFTIFNGFLSFGNGIKSSTLTSLNEEKMLAEAKDTDFEINLQEIRYYEHSAQEVAALFDKVLENKNAL